MKIGIIGTGNMGSALMQAFSLGRHTMRACNRSPEKLRCVCAETGAEAVSCPEEAVKGADLVLLAVKPVGMPELLNQIRDALTPEQIVVSIAVGLTLESYALALGADRKIVRAMPNTPAAVREGLTAFAFGENVPEEDRQKVLELFSLAGRTAVLPERLMNAVSALTGSGPAYAYLFLEAMADGACRAGIPRDQGYQMAAQTLLGAAKMVLETGKHPAQLKDEVCSPGGTTIRAVAELEKGCLRGTVMEAIRVCTEAAG